MASYNKQMDKWHAYKKISVGVREHLGYYHSEADALEAEKLGQKTERAIQNKPRGRRTGKSLAGKYLKKMADGVVDSTKGAPANLQPVQDDPALPA